MIEQLIKQSFNRAAKTYKASSIIQQEIGQQLIERLQYYTISPKRILDLGAGASDFAELLKKRYPKSEVIACDFAENMLREHKPKRFKKTLRLCANARQLPFADNSIDLIFSNQMMEWIPNLQVLFQELNRVLRKDGLLLFSGLGPDTFSELKRAWQSVDDLPHVHNFVDFHDVGDDLLRAGFSMPVLDTEEICLQYGSLKALLKELRGQGIRNLSPNRFKGLTSRGRWQRFELAFNALKTKHGKSPLSYEVFYAQAFKGLKKRAPTEQTFSLEQLKNSVKKENN